MSTNSHLSIFLEDIIKKIMHQSEYVDSHAGALTESTEWPAINRLIDKQDVSWRDRVNQIYILLS